MAAKRDWGGVGCVVVLLVVIGGIGGAIYYFTNQGSGKGGRRTLRCPICDGGRYIFSTSKGTVKFRNEWIQVREGTHDNESSTFMQFKNKCHHCDGTGKIRKSDVEAIRNRQAYKDRHGDKTYEDAMSFYEDE